MRIAAISDIHGNLPALEAVLADIERMESDLIVIGGEITSSPMPHQTLDLLMALGPRTQFILGNADRELVACFDGDVPPERRSNDDPRHVDAWAARQITSQQRDFLVDLPESIVVEVDGMGQVRFCHGSRRSDEEIITVATPEDRMRDMVTGIAQRVVVCGHTHMQFEHRIGETRVLSAGSAGMPYEGRPAPTGSSSGRAWPSSGPSTILRQPHSRSGRAASRELMRSARRMSSARPWQPRRPSSLRRWPRGGTSEHVRPHSHAMSPDCP